MTGAYVAWKGPHVMKLCPLIAALRREMQQAGDSLDWLRSKHDKA